MNDELDTLRSFRPEVAGPTDALTTEGRNALMTAIDAERLPRPARRRRFVRVAVVLAAALVVVGSVAAASGLIPDDVRQSLGLASEIDPVLTPDVDQAVKRASAPSPDGGTVELWTAPTNGGGTCAYLRHLDADGAPTDDRGVGCQAAVAGGARVIGSATRSSGSRGVATTMIGEGGLGGMSYHLELASGGATTLYGKAPAGATEVVLTQKDGTITTAAVTEDGWWLLVLPASTDADSLDRLEGRSASGATVASTQLRTAAPPDAITGGLGNG